MPLRACANPATVIGQSFKTSISTGASFHTYSKSVLRTSPVSHAKTVQSWSPRQEWAKSISASSKRSLATSSPLLSADAASVKGSAEEVKSSPARRNYVKYLVILGLLGAGAFAFSDNVRHIYGAVRRSGRVVGTLAVCINEYVDWKHARRKGSYQENVLITLSLIATVLPSTKPPSHRPKTTMP